VISRRKGAGKRGSEVGGEVVGYTSYGKFVYDVQKLLVLFLMFQERG
jgi:hypothetical protein